MVVLKYREFLNENKRGDTMGIDFGAIFGGGGAPKVQAAPAVAAVETEKAGLSAEEKAARALRSQLFATSGGVLGEEVQAGGVTKKSNLFGN